MAEAKKVVSPLDIDNLLGTTWNRIDRMGVELEGGWKALPDGIPPTRDTSVFKDQGNKMPGYHVGEIPIGPMLPAALSARMKKFYPDFVDHSCGMHVHMSFETLLFYQTLMSPEYQETVCEYLLRWAKKEEFPIDHCIWPRLRGESLYCQKKFWPDAQVNFKSKDHDQKRHGHRYTVVNFVNRPPQTPTVEIRVLPMMKTVEQGIRGVEMILDITNACLYKMVKSKDGKFKGKLELPDGGAIEHDIEEEIPLTPSQRSKLKGGW